MKNISAVLGDFGLSKVEAQVYEIALGLGTFPASILGNRLGIPRSTARYTCESLVQKGLMVATKKANTKLFVAENPTKLFVMFHAEEDQLMRKKEQLSHAVKELQRTYNPDAKIPKVMFYEWIDGVGRMLDDLLKSTQSKSHSPPMTLCAFGAGDYISWQEPNIVNKIRSKSLKKYKSAMIIRAPKYKYLYENWIKKDKYFQYIDELKVDIQIAEDTISILSIEHSSPIWLIIKHQDIANAFRQIFMELWMRKEKEHVG